MKIKEGTEISTMDFWHDLTQGYINPDELLENKDDIERVKNALSIVQEFESSCVEQIPDFVQ